MLACESCYNERKQDFKGIQTNNILEISGANPKSPTPTKSEDFKGSNYRGYDSSVGTVIKGSETEKKTLDQIRQNPNVAIPIVNNL